MPTNHRRKDDPRASSGAEATAKIKRKIGNTGRAWVGDEARSRHRLTPEKLEMVGGKLLWTDENRENPTRIAPRKRRSGLRRSPWRPCGLACRGRQAARPENKEALARATG